MKPSDLYFPVVVTATAVYRHQIHKSHTTEHCSSKYNFRIQMRFPSRIFFCSWDARSESWDQEKKRCWVFCKDCDCPATVKNQDVAGSGCSPLGGSEDRGPWPPRGTNCSFPATNLSNCFFLKFSMLPAFWVFSFLRIALKQTKAKQN